MKETPFINFHKERGAKLIPFVGYNMPVEYTGITDETLTVREKVGVFDVSHMGEFWVTGAAAFDFLQYITSNDLASLFDGKAQYTCFTNGKGGIVDDLLIYRFNTEKYLLVVNASNIEKDWNWCLNHALRFGIESGRDIINASDNMAQLAVQGPFALKAMQKLTSADIENMEYYTFIETEFAGIKNVIISITGYTGEKGCEIYVNNADAAKLWKSIFEAGAEFGIKPIGLGARDTLRLEMGFCLYGNDIDDNTSPIEAGLGWITKFTPQKDFIDKALLLKQKEEGVNRRLKGFVMIDRGIPRKHYQIVNNDNETIGEVTSGTMSPTLNQGIGLAYLSKNYWTADSEIFIVIRDKKLKARVVNLPFYKNY